MYNNLTIIIRTYNDSFDFRSNYSTIVKYTYYLPCNLIIYWYILLPMKNLKFQLKNYSGGFQIKKYHGCQSENYIPISTSNNRHCVWYRYRYLTPRNQLSLIFGKIRFFFPCTLLISLLQLHDCTFKFLDINKST